jgi:hypothetical protein
MIESDIVLLYIRSHVWGIIMQWDLVWRLYRPPPPPWRPFSCDIRQQKVLDIAIDEVLGPLSMHVAPPAIWIVCGTRRSDNPVRAS